MKIILISGPSNSGKTTVINAVFDNLCGGNRKAHNVLVYNAPIGNPIQKDFEAVVDYKNKKVAFCSMGDYKTYCLDSIVKYAGADVLIMALNNHFSPILSKNNIHANNCFPAYLLFKSKNFFASNWVQTIINAI